MSDFELESLSLVLAFAALMGLVALLRGGRIDRLWFALTLAVYALYELTYWIARHVEVPLLDGSRWNWDGKVLATLLVLLLIGGLPGIGRRDVGLTLRQGEGARAGWLVTLALCAVFTVAALLVPPAGFEGDWETLTFQLTMPSIDEELFFRGLLLLMIDRSLNGSWRVLGANIGWGGLISSILFGLVHAIDVDGGAFSLSFSVVYFSFVGLILVWLRARTESLVAPIFIHSYGNAVFLVV